MGFMESANDRRDWEDRMLEALAARDAHERQLTEIYTSFREAAKRAAELDAAVGFDAAGPLSNDPEEKGSMTGPGAEKHRERATIAAQAGRIEVLAARVEELSRMLKITTQKLEQAQLKARQQAEEQYMKTYAVQSVQDELLALTIQLNASEKRAEELQIKNTSLLKRVAELEGRLN